MCGHSKPQAKLLEAKKNRTPYSPDSSWVGCAPPSQWPALWHQGTETRPGLSFLLSPCGTSPRGKPCYGHSHRCQHVRVTHQLLEEVTHTLLVAPLLYTGEQPIIELLVDLIELRHFEENGLDLLAGQHWLGGGGSGFQRLHGLEDSKVRRPGEKRLPFARFPRVVLAFISLVLCDQVQVGPWACWTDRCSTTELHSGLIVFHIPREKKLKERENLATEVSRQYLPAPREVQISRMRYEVNPNRQCSPAAAPPDGSGTSPRWPGFRIEPTFSSPSPFPNPVHSAGREAETSAPPEDKPETIHWEGRGRSQEPWDPFSHCSY